MKSSFRRASLFDMYILAGCYTPAFLAAVTIYFRNKW